MSRYSGSTGLLVTGGLALLLSGTATVFAQRPAPAAVPRDEPASVEEERDRVALQRFVGLLEKNPRRGTALDRVYGYHVERGSLDGLVKSYKDRVAKAPTDGISWMVLGLLESQRGQDAAAVASFRKAEDTRPTDALAPYYLGQSLVLVGQPRRPPRPSNAP